MHLPLYSKCVSALYDVMKGANTVASLDRLPPPGRGAEGPTGGVGNCTKSREKVRDRGGGWGGVAIALKSHGPVPHSQDWYRSPAWGLGTSAVNNSVLTSFRDDFLHSG